MPKSQSKVLYMMKKTQEEERRAEGYLKKDKVEERFPSTHYFL
jgi:hypothetical protein